MKHSLKLRAHKITIAQSKRQLLILVNCMIAVCTSALFTASASAQVILAESRLDTGIDGWWLCGDPDADRPHWDTSGYVEAVDTQEGVHTWFVAPPKFLGDISATYGLELTFDLKPLHAGQNYGSHDVVLIGAGRRLHINNLPDPPPGVWTTYRIRMDEAAWSGNLTREQFMDVLRDVTSLRIRAEFWNGPDVVGLDNVVLQGCPRNPADIDRDADVDIQDLAFLLAAFGTICP